MDINNSSPGGYITSSPSPLAYDRALARKEQEEGHAQMTETEKEHLILQCKDAGSQKEMQKINTSLRQW